MLKCSARPARRRLEFFQNPAYSLVMPMRARAGANIMSPRSHRQQLSRAHSLIFVQLQHARPAKPIVKLQAQAQHVPGMGLIFVEKRRPDFEALEHRPAQVVTLRQSLPPLPPKRSRTEHLLPVCLNPLCPLRRDRMVPARAFFFVAEDVIRGRRGPKHVEIVHFAQLILNRFQILAPHLVMPQAGSSRRHNGIS